MSHTEFDADQALESLIRLAYETMQQSRTPIERRFWFRRMQQFIADRSPEQVMRMELERRLA